MGPDAGDSFSYPGAESWNSGIGSGSVSGAA